MQLKEQNHFACSRECSCSEAASPDKHALSRHPAACVHAGGQVAAGAKLHEQDAVILCKWLEYMHGSSIKRGVRA